MNKTIGLKHLSLKEVQTILRKHFKTPTSCFGLNFTATVDHDMDTEHQVNATLYLDDDGGLNLNQLVIHNRFMKNDDCV